MAKHFLVRLSAVEHQQATSLAASPLTPARCRQWMAILLEANQGHSDQEIASKLELSVTTVQRIRQRYAQKGFASLAGTRVLATLESTKTGYDWSVYNSLLAGNCQIEGLVGAVLVDCERNVCLAGDIKLLGAAALSNASLVRAALVQSTGVDEILVTDASWYHLVRVVSKDSVIYLNVVVDRAKSNLALARYQLDTLLGQRP